MKTVLLLGGPAAGQRVEVHGAMRSWATADGNPGYFYHLVPMCSHGEVHWFGVLDGADPLALLIAGYAPAPRRVGMHPALGMGYAPVDPLIKLIDDQMQKASARVEAAQAALAYDAAIQSCADTPDAMSSYCTDQGDTLDTLYADWVTKSRAVLAEYRVTE